MSKKKEENCGSCGWAKWPVDKRGYRMKKNRVGDCMCPIPDLPHSMIDPRYPDKSIMKRNIYVEMGNECPLWTPEQFFKELEAEIDRQKVLDRKDDEAVPFKSTDWMLPPDPVSDGGRIGPLSKRRRKPKRGE